MFFTRKQTALGLDIGPGSVKALELDKNAHGYKIRGYAQASLPKGAIISDVVNDKKTLAYILHQVLSRPQTGSFSTHRAVINLPESKSFVRVIQIPVMSESDAKNAIPFEAENFIPLPVDQVYLDWQILETVGDKMSVLIIASPKEYVDGFLEILDGVGIKSVALEVESQSCHRSLIPVGNSETTLIVDVSDSRTNLIMVEKGNLQFTSTIPIAGNSFTEAIARGLGVAAIKAEAIKQKVGIANTVEYPNIKTLLLPALSSLTAEVKNIIKFHEEHSATPLNCIVFSGGGAKLLNLVDYVKGEFSSLPNVRVGLGNPWINVSPLVQSNVSPAASLDMSTAIGLALRGINPLE